MLCNVDSNIKRKLHSAPLRFDKKAVTLLKFEKRQETFPNFTTLASLPVIIVKIVNMTYIHLYFLFPFLYPLIVSNKLPRIALLDMVQ